ncbi:sulfate/molybdate ABC transporter ATP-binding protein [Paracoccus shanxieyensis]|uniref:Sulfate ABC transporter ATP-binding protein n=1 Tax=Paracoccus shanxieyensis TaxID=2675752 RepID=A0A6L6IT89_9RHOB|nr:sulfate/molybdate ABC transporter ATP-binding protein [Paracoccus shanxieyensis]MTH63656.1 sulfate ABC transporter ATP-binding protein [Paracoccus shanxieyensis]MTH86833.1 sulfate ABC transporter ATP-binding protein [Paracoccus shanxieyensis]
MSISIQNMTKSFGATQVLRGIDLGIQTGELVALLGPSGSGKTTLLKIIAGLEWPDAGGLNVDGRDWLGLAAQDRRIGFVFQHYALFPHMSVRDNIAFGLTVRPRAERPGKSVIAAKVDELLHFLQISHLGDRYPAQLSGGQRQRVALGRALAIQPTVLLLDEPFGALDAAVRRDLRAWLRGVHEETGSTTIFVTHDQEEAFELADRVVVMGDGRIEQIGNADQIHDHPASPFVARFMGATIELPVTIRAGRVEAPGLDTSRLPRRALPDGPAMLFLRPDDAVPVADANGRFHVSRCTSNGAILRLDLTDGQTTLPLDLPRRAPEAKGLTSGTRVALRVEAGAIFSNGREPARPVTEFPRKEKSL